MQTQKQIDTPPASPESITVETPQPDDTFEGFMLSRLMAGESDGSGLSR